ncbi:Hypothetical protein SMAX5B_011027, partial [Scophthalmus maximus]
HIFVCAVYLGFGLGLVQVHVWLLCGFFGCACAARPMCTHALYLNTAAGHRGPALVGHGALKANGGECTQRAWTKEWEVTNGWKGASLVRL